MCLMNIKLQKQFKQQIKKYKKRMPSNICSMTGQIIKQGAVSKKTGHLYQKSVIIKHLSSFPYCPITNVQMSIDDLIFIQGNNKQNINRPDESTNQLLNQLKSEYDRLVLEKFYLRKNISIAKEQLCHSLAANEASERLIGKLLKEKASIENQLDKMKTQLSQSQKSK